MSTEIEIEFKTLLAPADYQRLLTEFAIQPERAFTQTNVYFDTPSLTLKGLQMGLRIRLFETSGELTLKSPLAAGTIGLLETTDHLSLDEAHRLIATGKILTTGAVAAKLAPLLQLEDLRIQAQLKTSRVEQQLDEQTLLVLDESWYHGQHDYELEMEVQEALAGEKFFTAFLAARQIPYLPGPNKISRALQAQANK